MRALCGLLLLVIGVTVPATLQAGDIVEFQPGRVAAPVLQHTKLRAVVAEFLDSGNTGTGKALGYLIWREILTAIADQAGAGVILARAPGSQRLVDLLQERYHEAALEVAKRQAARMALWGVVEEQGRHLFVGTYLSILPDAKEGELRLRLVGGLPVGANMSAEIPRTRLNFPLVETSRDALFRRRVVARAGARVLDAMGGQGRLLVQPAPGTALDAEDIVEGWFKVRLSDGRTGYVRHDLVDLPPLTIEIPAKYAELRESPRGPARPPVHLSDSYRVLNMRYVSGSGLWYEIDAGPAIRGWLPAWQGRARFSLPAVHFVAGLYRYQLGRYDDAQREFEQYLRVRELGAPGVEPDNTSLATGYQLLGASQLLGKQAIARAADGRLTPVTRNLAVDAFSRAITLTPWDPAAYNLRALARLSLTGTIRATLSDLGKAIDLDPDNARARALIAALVAITTTGQPGKGRLVDDARDPAVRQELDNLTKRLDARGRSLR